jgi:hypothetical protein
VKLDRSGIGEIMKSAELAGVLASVADEVATAAGGDASVVVEYDRRKSRVIAMVVSNDFGHEMATGALARAVSGRTESWR